MTQDAKLRTQTVAQDEAGIRLDRWFRRHYPALSHGILQKYLRTGQVRVDGRRAEAALRLEPGQAIRVPPGAEKAGDASPQASAKRQERDASRLRGLILYEDDDVIVLNKPSGLAVQGGTGLKENLDDMLQALAGSRNGKPKLVHRLDRDTSGVLLVARNALAASRLAEAFRDRATRKIYWGVTRGVPVPAEGKIDVCLVRRGELAQTAKADDEDAKTAVTFYKIAEKAAKQAAFVVLWPLTGRTHQLRVHMAHLGAPLIGDRLYGDGQDPFATAEIGKGLHLHARRLTIPHPRRGEIDIVAPLGPDMRKTWAWFGFDANDAYDFADIRQRPRR